MRLYRFFHRLFSVKNEKGEYSAGLWQDIARSEALRLCSAARGRLLELGCGEGLFLARLAVSRPDLEIWGSDMDEGRISLARERMASLGLKNVSLLRAEGASGDECRAESFDHVVCVNVLLNLDGERETRRILGECARVCKKGGKVVFDFRNGANPALRLKYRFARCYDPTVRELPLHAYTLKRIRMMMRDAGLEPVSVTAKGFFWKAWAPVVIVEAVKNV